MLILLLVILKINAVFIYPYDSGKPDTQFSQHNHSIIMHYNTMKCLSKDFNIALTAH
jgi:hypothetical protein